MYKCNPCEGKGSAWGGEDFAPDGKCNTCDGTGILFLTEKEVTEREAK